MAMAVVLVALAVGASQAQEARRRWEMERQIRLDKFEQVLPRAMRNNGIDMWIVAVKENHFIRSGRTWDAATSPASATTCSPTGAATASSASRSDRAATSSTSPAPTTAVGRLRCSPQFVRQRDPKRIGVNMSDEIGPADGLSPRCTSTCEDARRTLRRALVSAEQLVSRVPLAPRGGRIVAFGEAAGIAISWPSARCRTRSSPPGKTTLEDVAWWLQDRLLERGLGSEFDMPSVYVTGPRASWPRPPSASCSRAT